MNTEAIEPTRDWFGLMTGMPVVAAARANDHGRSGEITGWLPGQEWLPVIIAVIAFVMLRGFARPKG